MAFVVSRKGDRGKPEPLPLNELRQFRGPLHNLFDGITGGGIGEPGIYSHDANDCESIRRVDAIQE
jgi:hypothetical protein